MKDKIVAVLMKHPPGQPLFDLVGPLSDALLALFEELKTEIAKELEERQGADRDNLLRIASLFQTVKQKETKLMIAQEDLDASLKGLSDAINNAIANIPDGTRASTPDAMVLAFKSGVDTNTAALNAAEAAKPPTP